MSRQTASRHDDAKARAAYRLAAIAGAVTAGALLVAAFALWRENGLSVYMERLASGIASCF